MDNQMTTICPECSEEALLDDGDKCHNCGHKYEAPFAHQPDEMPADLEWSLECIDGNLSPDIGRTIRKYLSFPMRESSAQWQLIETAPKDGTPIIAYSPEGVMYVSWHGLNNKWNFFDDGKSMKYYFFPSHWMPLPKPPTTDIEDGKPA